MWLNKDSNLECIFRKDMWYPVSLSSRGSCRIRIYNIWFVVKCDVQFHQRTFVLPVGLEPTTPCLKDRFSIQLNYRSMFSEFIYKRRSVVEDRKFSIIPIIICLALMLPWTSLRTLSWTCGEGCAIKHSIIPPPVHEHGTCNHVSI